MKDVTAKSSPETHLLTAQKLNGFVWVRSNLWRVKSLLSYVQGVLLRVSFFRAISTVDIWGRIVEIAFL